MGPVVLPHRTHERLGLPLRADDRHFPHRSQIEVDSPKHVPERLGVSYGEGKQQAEHPEGVTFVLAVARQQRKAQEPERSGRVARRDRGVLEVLAARRERLVVLRGGEETTALAIRETLDHRVGELHSLPVPPWVEGRLIERQKGLEQERVVLQVRVEPRLTVLPGPQEATVRVARLVQQEGRAGNRGL